MGLDKEPSEHDSNDKDTGKGKDDPVRESAGKHPG